MLAGLATAVAHHELFAQHTATLDRPNLTDAPRVEKKTINALLQGESWPRRALVAMRLERYG